MSAFLKVIREGGMMYFQDIGRYGWSYLGVSQGGAVDMHAHCWANYLLGNVKDSVTLEVAIGNASWEVLVDGEISLTGAEVDAKLDGVAISNWSTHMVCKGQVLSIGYACVGCYAYLGVKGGFKTEEVLGSRSTVIRNEMGQWIKEGEVIEVSCDEQNQDLTSAQKLIPEDYVPNYEECCEIRVMMPDSLEVSFREEFLNNIYRVSPASDRMGRKLESHIELPQLKGILSEGVSLGCIQLPPSGQPIVLLNDRQTQGGYEKVGNVARIDLPNFVQMRPGTEFRFTPISCELATQEWREFTEFFGL